MKATYSLMIRLLKMLTLTVCVAVTSVACATTSSDTAVGSNTDKGDSRHAYHWYDGDKQRSIRISSEYVADFAQKNVLQQASSQKENTASASPVFVDAHSGGAMRALPGGVIVRFSQAMNKAEADESLKQFGTYTVRPIGSAGKSWLVHAESGLPSLEMANRIYESGLVQSASPNWWQERTRK